MNTVSIARACFCLFITMFVFPAFAGNTDRKDEPPFTVAGTVIHPQEKRVLLNLLTDVSEDMDESGAQQWFHEGDTVSGYEIIHIEKDKVRFRHGDQVIRLAVGYGRASKERAPSEQVSPARGRLIPAGQGIVPYFPSHNDRDIQAIFIPPPEDIDDIRKETGMFLENLVSNPDFIRNAEALRSRILRQMEEDKKRKGENS